MDHAEYFSDQQVEAIALALLWLQSGQGFEWVYPDHIRVGRKVVAVQDAVVLANADGAAIDFPPSRRLS